MRPASTLAVALLAAAALAAGAGAPALSLGWFGGACDDAAAQNPGQPGECRYGAREAACGNRVDDDSDEAADCADPDCAGDPACPTLCARGERDGDGDCLLDEEAYPLSHACANFSDDDGDLATDCADPDCAEYPACRPEVCRNGADDDADGQADCADPECASTGDCWACLYRGDPGDCDPICTPATEVCGDGIDQDCDGQDLACGCPWWQVWGCGEKRENCDNGVDDDLDLLVDCADDSCANEPNCLIPPQEDCGNRRDDDRDGQADCADMDCAREPQCAPETACADGADNDWDGAADCADADCSGTIECMGDVAHEYGYPRSDKKEETGSYYYPDCNDQIDNDDDGRVDCSDQDCDLTVYKIELNNEYEFDKFFCVYPSWKYYPASDKLKFCGDGVDNDQNGLTDCNDPACKGIPTCDDTEFNCFDGIDNEGDGFVDCFDDECANWDNCNPEDICGDGIDNDFDGRTDCEDFDCNGAATVGPIGNVYKIPAPRENFSIPYDCQNRQVVEGTAFENSAMCFNGIDDDNDGLVDQEIGRYDFDCLSYSF